MGAERVERRLAAILAADVAGYSRLMERDEAGTLARLRTLRRELIDPKIAERKGRIDTIGHADVAHLHIVAGLQGSGVRTPHNGHDTLAGLSANQCLQCHAARRNIGDPAAGLLPIREHEASLEVEACALKATALVG